MKKICFWILAAGLLLSSAFQAPAAVDTRVSGMFAFGFGLYDGTNFAKHDGEESFDAQQMFRAQIDVIASDYLKGIAAFEIGNFAWGNGGGATWGTEVPAGRGTGGAMGADGVSVEVKNLYIDWTLPQTDLLIRMGIQYFALPTAVIRADAVAGNPVIDDDLAGILLSYNFTDNIGINIGWFRPWDPYINDDFKGYKPNSNSYANSDEIDLFTLTLPISYSEVFSLTPWFLYGSIGKVDDTWDPDTPASARDFSVISGWLSNNNMLGDNGSAWWTGLAFELDYLNPFYAALDVMYGSYDADRTDVKYFDLDNPDRKGWGISGKLAYRLDNFTPALYGWYGSGSDSNELYGGLMPSLAPLFAPTSFGFSNANLYNDDIMRYWVVSDSIGGTWGAGLAIEDIKIIDDLTSQVRFFYYQGTNDFESKNRELVKGGSHTFTDFRLMGTNDHAFEINLDNAYKIYENLDMFVNLAYINVSLDDKPDGFEENAWRGYVGFQYSF